MNSVFIKIPIRGKETKVKAIKVVGDGIRESRELAAKHFSKLKILNQYPVNAEKLEKIHKDYIVFDCHLVDIDPKIEYDHYYCVKNK